MDSAISSSSSEDEITDLLYNVMLIQEMEHDTLAGKTSKTLSALDISFEELPHKCQDLLDHVTELQMNTGLLNIHPESMRAKHYTIIKSKLELQHEVLELKHKNIKLKIEVENNKKLIENLRKELNEDKDNLDRQEINPATIQEHIKEASSKVILYQDIYEKNMAGYAHRNVPYDLMPISFQIISNILDKNRTKEAELKERADDLTMAYNAINMLRRMTRRGR